VTPATRRPPEPAAYRPEPQAEVALEIGLES
jgi:hypothetical protein